MVTTFLGSETAYQSVCFSARATSSSHEKKPANPPTAKEELPSTTEAVINNPGPPQRRITDLNMLLQTETLNDLSSTREKRTTLDHVQISRIEYENWISANADNLPVTVEFDGGKGLPVIKAAKSTVHSMVENFFCRWFDGIATKESQDSNEEYRATTEQRTRLPVTDSIRYPDAALIRLPTNRPVVAVEVGFSQVRQSLFEIGASYLRDGKIDAVILVDIQERDRGALAKKSWGFSNSTLANLERDEVIERAIAYHDSQSIAIVGKLSVAIFFWSRERKHPPPHPIRTYDSNTSATGIMDLHKMRNPMISKDGQLLLFGKSYDFPFSALENEIKASVDSEKYARIEDLICNTKADVSAG